MLIAARSAGREGGEEDDHHQNQPVTWFASQIGAIASAMSARWQASRGPLASRCHTPCAVGSRRATPNRT